LPDDLLFRLVDVFEQRDDHGDSKAADENVEYAGDIAQRQRTLRRALRQQPSSHISRVPGPAVNLSTADLICD